MITSYAPNLVSGDDNNEGDVFVRDRVDPATTVRASRFGTIDGNDESFGATISDDGGFRRLPRPARPISRPGRRRERIAHRPLRVRDVETKTLVHVSPPDADGGWP